MCRVWVCGVGVGKWGGVWVSVRVDKTAPTAT